MANSSQRERFESSKERAGCLPADLRLRFGALRLQVRAYWPFAAASPDQAPLIVLLTAGEDPGRAERFSTSLGSAAAAVVLLIPMPPGAPRAGHSAEGIAVAALGWAADHAGEFGAHPQRLAVAGSYAAGGLAARLAIVACQDGWPQLRRQLLVNPVFGSAYPMAAEVGGVAAATIATAQIGGAEGTRYAALLRRAGIEVEEIALAKRRATTGELGRLTHCLWAHGAEPVGQARQGRSTLRPTNCGMRQTTGGDRDHLGA